MTFEELRTQSPTYANEMAVINNVISDMLDTGIALYVTRRGEKRTALAGASRVRAFTRRIAADCKRPFVWAQHFIGPSGESLTIAFPRRKSMEPVMASLLLIAEHATNRYSHNNKPERFIYVSYGTKIMFEAHGMKPCYDLLHWIQTARANPDFRKILTSNSRK